MSLEPPEPTGFRRAGTGRPVAAPEAALYWGLAGAVAALSGLGGSGDGPDWGVALGVTGGACVPGLAAGVLLPRLRRSTAAGAVDALVRALAFATAGAVVGALAGSLGPASQSGGAGLAGTAGCAGAVAGVAVGAGRGGHKGGLAEGGAGSAWPLGWFVLGAVAAVTGGATLLVRSGAGAAAVGAAFGSALGGGFGLARPRCAKTPAVVWAVAGAGLGAGAAVVLDAGSALGLVAAGTLVGAISGEQWGER